MEFWLEFIQEHVVTAVMLLVAIISLVSKLKKHLKAMFNIVKEKADTADINVLLNKINKVEQQEDFTTQALMNLLKSQLKSKVIDEDIKEEYRKAIELYEKLGE